MREFNLHSQAIVAIDGSKFRTPELEVVADRGYYSGAELKACEDAGIRTYVPKPMTSNDKAEGRFYKSEFIYIAPDDEYQCPAGHRAVYRFTSSERDMQTSLLEQYMHELRDQRSVHPEQVL